MTGWDKTTMPHKAAAISFVKGMAAGDVPDPPLYYANFMKDGSVCMMATTAGDKHVVHMQFINGEWTSEDHELS